MAKVLGISCYYHDSAAAYLEDGVIVAAAEEERFTRRKHDTAFPFHAINYCLGQAGAVLDEVDAVAFYEKPLARFQRTLLTHARQFPRSLPAFIKTIPDWLGRRLLVPHLVRRHLSYDGPLLFVDHHLAHAGSAALLSPFRRPAYLTVDGTGEWTTASIGRCTDGLLEPLAQVPYPHSLGMLYSTITAWLGFPVNEGEGRVMGLAAYGEPELMSSFEKLVHFEEHGAFRLDMSYFSFPRSTRRMFSQKLAALLGPPRQPEEPLEDRHRAVAATLQAVVEKGLLRLAGEAHRRVPGADGLALAGGVMLNCVANGRILREGPFDQLFIQPAAGDSGAALGAAAVAHRSLFPRIQLQPMETALLGPDYSNREIEGFLRAREIPMEQLEEELLLERVARMLSENRIVGWFQGRMEFGPRALGARSILASPADPGMKDRINSKVKGREPFRPFAPSVLEEQCSQWFDLEVPSPYMVLAAPVREEARDNIPAVVHQDGTARIQTVSPSVNRLYHQLISVFGQRTGLPLLLNTSFNLKGEPIVCNPVQAYDCFKRSGMDALVLGDCLVQQSRGES